MSEGLEVALVLKSEFEQELRLDSELFQRKFINLAKLVSENQITKLGDEALSIKKGIFDIKADSYSEHGVPFVRISNLKNMLIDTKDIIYIPEHESRNNPDSFLKKNDIILSKTAYPAASLVNLDFCNASQDTIAVKIKHDSKLMSHFVVVYLNTVFGLEAMKRRFTGNIQMHLNLEDCKNLSIPVLSYSFQQKVKEVFEQGIISTVNSKSAYASAETLLLQSLGLSDFDFDAGEGVNSNIKPFAASFLESGRLDAEYYQRKYDKLLELCSAKAVYMKQIEEIQKFNARGLQPEYVVNGEVDVINSRHILEKHLDYDNFEKTTLQNWHLQAKAQVLKNDILIYTTGANIGRSQVYLKSDKALASNHVNILRVKNENPVYLAFVLNSKIGRLQTEKLSAGSAQQELYPKHIAQFYIPFIHEKGQSEISNAVVESYNLQRQSEKLLTLAKRAVEIAIEQGEAAGEALLEAALSEETT